jgi:hypothetical protein
MSYVGLIFIIIGWAIQLMRKDKTIDIKFVVIYSLGVALLAIDGFVNGLIELAVLNLISFILAFAVFMKLRR